MRRGELTSGDLKHLPTLDRARCRRLLAVGLAAGRACASVRPEVGKPLQQAADLLKAGKAQRGAGQGARGRRGERQDAAEQLMIERMKRRRRAARRRQRHRDPGLRVAVQLRQAAAGRAGADGRADRLRLLAAEGLAAGPTNGCRRRRPPAAPARSSSSCRRTCRAKAATTRPSPRKRRPAVRPPKRPAASPTRATCCAWPMPQQRTGQHTRRARHARQAAGPLPEEGVLVDPAWRSCRASPASPTASRSTCCACAGHRQADARPTTTWRWRSSRCRRATRSKAGRSSKRAYAQRRARHRRRGRAPQAPARPRSSRPQAESKAGIEQDAQEAAALKDGNELVQVGYHLRDDGPGRQGHPADRTRHRQGRPEAPRGRQAAAGLAQLQSGKNKSKALQTLRSVQRQRRRRRARAAVGGAREPAE